MSARAPITPEQAAFELGADALAASIARQVAQARLEGYRAGALETLDSLESVGLLRPSRAQRFVARLRRQLEERTDA